MQKRMKIGLICPEVPGHLNPLTTLGRELQRRGHRVSVIGSKMAQPITERAGLAFCCLGSDDELSVQLEVEFRKLGQLSGIRSMSQTGKIFGLGAKLLLRYLPQILSEQLFDGLVIDQLSPAACVIAEKHAVPFVIACNALAMRWDSMIPPPPLFWSHQTMTMGRLRKRVIKVLLPRIYYWLSDQSETKVNPLLLVFEHQHGLAHIAQQPAFFDFPFASHPSLLHYTGPWHTPERDDALDFPWEWLDGRPLIYASMGTLQNNLSSIFDMIVEAVKTLPLQVVLSKGGSPVTLSRPLPDNVLLVERAPQLKLLEKVSLAITHAGLNTALECLTYGVPMLCLPVTNDQPGVAKRIEWLGAGKIIPLHRATPQRIKEALVSLLNDPAYAQKANEYQQRLAQTRGVEEAVNIIERAFISKAPVPVRHP